MLKPNAGEGQNEFIARFENDQAMKEQFPDDAQRKQVGVSAWEHRDKLENAAAGVKSYDFKILLPGLVNYDEMEYQGRPLGNVMVPKEVFDKIAPTFIGKPIVNGGHKDIGTDSYKKGEADGIITGSYFSNDDGWFHVTALVWDPDTQTNIEQKKFQCSCAYGDLKFEDVAGVQGNIPYRGTIRGGVGEHVATLTNPRYRGATIVQNHGGSKMKLTLLKTIKKMINGKEEDTLENAGEFEAAEITVPHNGKDLKMSDLIAVYNAATTVKKFELVNGKITDMTADTVLNVDGKDIKLGDMLNAYDAKNAEDEEAEKAEKKKKEEEAAAAKNAAEEEEKKKKDEEEKLENSHKAGDHEAKHLPNCKACNAAGAEAERKLKNAREKGMNVPAPVVRTRQERFAIGDEMFGSKK